MGGRALPSLAPPAVELTTPPSGTADLIVVGGGIVGCTLARAAAREGLGVVVLEKQDEVGRAATWAAGGMLSPFGEADGPGAFLELGLASLRLYPGFVRAVESESGRDVGLTRCGKLELALDEGQARILGQKHAWLEEGGHPVRWLDEDRVRDREPTLSDRVRGAILLEEEAQVDNRRLGSAVAAAAAAAGAEIRTGTGARRVLVSGRRVEGVVLDDGSRLRSARLVVAAGAWSGRLEGLPRSLPVRPVRGQMVALGPPGPRLSTVVHGPDVYLIPREDGRVVVGSTMEEAGFRAETTAEAVAGLLRSALEAAPALAASPVLEAWAGLRPGTPDDLPVLGEDPEVGGLFYATGHFRNGILLAPVTAACLLPLLTGRGRPPLDLEPFLPGRFGAKDSAVRSA